MKLKLNLYLALISKPEVTVTVAWKNYLRLYEDKTLKETRFNKESILIWVTAKGVIIRYIDRQTDQ